MIIWRGWGFLGLVVAAVCAGAVGGLTILLLGKSYETIGGGLGFLLAAVACWYLGQYLNISRPAKKIDEHLELQRAEMWERFHTGAFQAAPGSPAPASEEEARAQIEGLIDEMRPGLLRSHRNVHTLFFIPIQWLSVVFAALGVGLIISGIGKL